MKVWKFSGTLLTATGIIHTVVALLSGWETYKEMLQDGFINSVGDDFKRGFALWFLICGILLIFLGQTLQHYIKKEQKPAPLFLGHALLLISIVGCFIEPVSGFWLFIPQALIIVFANRKTSP